MSLRTSNGFRIRQYAESEIVTKKAQRSEVENKTFYDGYIFALEKLIAMNLLTDEELAESRAAETEMGF